MDKEILLYRSALGAVGSTLLLILRTFGAQAKDAFKKRKEEKHLARLFKSEVQENVQRIREFSDSIQALVQRGTGGFGVNLPPHYPTATAFGSQIFRLLESSNESAEMFLKNLRAVQFFEKVHTDYHKLNIPAMQWTTHPNVQYVRILTNMKLLEQIELTAQELVEQMEMVEKGSKTWQFIEKKWPQKIIFVLLLIFTFTLVPSEAD